MIARRVMMNDKLQNKGGTQIICEDCKGSKFSGLTLYGRSKQVTTKGAQLFPPPSLGSQEKNGITIDCMEDGKIRISGTTEILTDFYLSRLQLVAGQYTFSAGVNIDASVLRYALVDDIGVPYFDVHSDYTTDTIKEPIEVKLLLRVYAGKTIDLTVKPMLNAGSAPLPWEPYTGGLPSPSPDYPQEIVSVGQGKTIGINVRGKNLIPFPYPLLGGAGTKTELNGVTYTVQEDGGVRCIGTPNSVFGVSLSMIRFSDQSLSVDEPTDGKVVLSGGPLYFDPNNKKLFFFFSAKQVGNQIDTVIYPQIEIGTVATPYEPYRKPQYMSVATPNGLPGIPVSSGGNYTDADRQQWVCDEIDFNRGVYVQRVAYTIVDGNEIKFTARGSEFWNLPDGSAPGCGDHNTAINNFFSKNTFGANGRFDFIYALSANMEKYFKTPDELNEFCKSKHDAGTPLTLYYELTAPVETPLTSDQLAAYKQLHTYADSITIIDNDVHVYMGVTYRRLRD